MRKILLTLLATAIALPAFAFDAPFNSFAFEMRKMPLANEWTAIKAAPDFTSEFVDIVVKNAEGMNDVQKIKYVNTVVNTYVKYVPDIINAKMPENWQTAETTIQKRKGDCEDYAILKMHLLKKLNIQSEILVVWIKSIKEGHAVLSATVGEETYILDNRAEKALLDSEVTDYEPIFLFNDESNYILGTKKNS